MGEYHKLAGKLEYAIASKDADKALLLIDSLLSNTDTLMDYMKSSLYEHMTFNEQVTDDEKMQATADMVKSTQLKCFFEDDAYENLTVLTTAEVGETVTFRIEWFVAFNNEGYDIVIYDPNGYAVASASKLLPMTLL